METFTFNETLQKRPETSYIIIHHSGVKTPHTAEDIHRWHQKRKWAGIAYHYFIDKKGKVFIGRPVDTIGAHAKGYNRNSIGVCFEGDFTKEKMKAEQLSKDAIELLFFLELAYGLEEGLDNGGMAELKLNPLTGEFDMCGGGGSLLFCDDLEGYKGDRIDGFMKDELMKKLMDYADWFNTERERVFGGVEAKRFNDWVVSRCNDFGINFSL